MAMILPLVLVGLYLAYVLLLFAVQGSIIFPRQIANRYASPSSRPEGVESWWIDTPDGDRVEAWFARAPGASADDPKPAVVFFHGNGELIEHCLHIMALYLERDISVLLVEYRGYGRSGGSPSERGIVADAASFREMLLDRADVDARSVIYHGRSLGGGVACSLARTHPPAGIVTESTFRSVTSITRRFLVPGLICRHPFRNDLALEEYRGPVLLLHGTDDHLIPHGHSEALDRIAADSTLVLLDGGHNDFPRDEEAYERAIDRLIDRVRTPEPSSTGTPLDQ